MRWITLFLFLVGSGSFAQETRKLYEVGTFQMTMYSPDYPASDQYHSHYLIVPIFYYYGKTVRSDQEGIFRYRFLDGGVYGVDMNFLGSFPAKSKENDMRTGMPDLDWMGEFGPRFYTYLFRD